MPRVGHKCSRVLLHIFRELGEGGLRTDGRQIEELL